MTPIPAPADRGMSWPARIGWFVLAVMCLGIAGYASRYVIDPPSTPEEALGNVRGVPFLFLHVAGAVVALLVGSLQFLPGLRKGARRAHRWTGRVYVLGCLVGGGAGLVLAPGSFAGPIATAGFGALAVLWIGFTLLGWRAAVQGRYVAHRRWMIRSWALTLAAVTLRIYLPLVQIFEAPFLPWYQAISFLCWVPNLMVAEVWLARTSRPTVPWRPNA